MAIALGAPVSAKEFVWHNLIPGGQSVPAQAHAHVLRAAGMCRRTSQLPPNRYCWPPHHCLQPRLATGSVAPSAWPLCTPSSTASLPSLAFRQCQPAARRVTTKHTTQQAGSSRQHTCMAGAAAAPTTVIAIQAVFVSKPTNETCNQALSGCAGLWKDAVLLSAQSRHRAAVAVVGSGLFCCL